MAACELYVLFHGLWGTRPVVRGTPRAGWVAAAARETAIGEPSLVPPIRFERMTYRLQGGCSTS